MGSSLKVNAEVLASDPYMLPHFRGELFFAQQLKEIQQSFAAKNLQEEIHKLKLIRQNFLRRAFFNMLVFITFQILTCKTCEDTAIEKAEAAIAALIKNSG